jgi:phosphatidate cytidylyltransferase
MWLIYSFLSDAGCLVFGKLFGKTPLQKQISPGKTLEGTIGGFLFTILFSVLIS